VMMTVSLMDCLAFLAAGYLVITGLIHWGSGSNLKT
jgi:hypothetical protein